MKDYVCTTNNGGVVLDSGSPEVALHSLALVRHHSLLLLGPGGMVGIHRLPGVVQQIGKGRDGWIELETEREEHGG